MKLLQRMLRAFKGPLVTVYVSEWGISAKKDQVFVDSKGLPIGIEYLFSDDAADEGNTQKFQVKLREYETALQDTGLRRIKDHFDGRYRAIIKATERMIEQIPKAATLGELIYAFKETEYRDGRDKVAKLPSGATQLDVLQALVTLEDPRKRQERVTAIYTDKEVYVINQDQIQGVGRNSISDVISTGFRPDDCKRLPETYAEIDGKVLAVVDLTKKEYEELAKKAELDRKRYERTVNELKEFSRQLMDDLLERDRALTAPRTDIFTRTIARYSNS